MAKYPQAKAPKYKDPAELFAPALAIQQAAELEGGVLHPNFEVRDLAVTRYKGLKVGQVAYLASDLKYNSYTEGVIVGFTPLMRYSKRRRVLFGSVYQGTLSVVSYPQAKEFHAQPKVEKVPLCPFCRKRKSMAKLQGGACASASCQLAFLRESL